MKKPARTRARGASIANRKSQFANSAFTLIEFMVIFGILIILLSIFIPYLMKNWEIARRTQCANNLKQISDALSYYADANGKNFPRVVYDEVHQPTGYTAFTGADDANPFAANSSVQANDVTASLWLLVRGGLVSPRAFICPGSDDTSDLMTDQNGLTVTVAQRSNFRRPKNLSYSYASPFSNAFNFKLNSDWLKSNFALMADKNPGISGQADVMAPAYNADPLQMSRANSLQHGRAGQNVLYPNKQVAWMKTPYAGATYVRGKADNIYTARAIHTTTQPTELPVELNGFCDRSLSPASPDDSYLVPTAQDVESPPRRKPPATQPSTGATTAPSTQR